MSFKAPKKPRVRPHEKRPIWTYLLIFQIGHLSQQAVKSKITSRINFGPEVDFGGQIDDLSHYLGVLDTPPFYAYLKAKIGGLKIKGCSKVKHDKGSESAFSTFHVLLCERLQDNLC